MSMYKIHATDATEINVYSNNGDREEDKRLMEPITHISKVASKGTRRKFAEAFNLWLQIPHDKLERIVQTLRLLHVAAIVLDDIQDGTVLRRGVPASHVVYGIRQTLSAINYTYFVVIENIIFLGHPDAKTVFTEEQLKLHRGQGIDVYWRDHCICPTEEEYKFMAERKTGVFFNTLVRLMQLFSNCRENFEPLINILGLYFQVRDDYFNLCDRNYHDEKGYCDDLTEGKFSLPIIHAIRSDPDDTKIINILRKRPTDVNIKRYCVDLLEKFGSFRYTNELLDELDQKARKEIKRLGGNPLLERILDGWKETIINCNMSRK